MRGKHDSFTFLLPKQTYSWLKKIYLICLNSCSKNIYVESFSMDTVHYGHLVPTDSYAEKLSNLKNLKSGEVTFC